MKFGPASVKSRGRCRRTRLTLYFLAMCSVGALAGNLFAAAPFTFSYTAGSLGSVRFNHTATLLQNGKVLVAGGGNSGSNPFLSTAELFEPANGTWSATDSMGSPRAYHSATMLPMVRFWWRAVLAQPPMWRRRSYTIRRAEFGVPPAV